MSDSEPDIEPGSEPESGDAAVETVRVTGWYRRPPGVAWLIGLVLVPLLLAVIGYGLAERSLPEAGKPTGALPTLTETSVPDVPPPAPPALTLAPLTIVRSGDQVTLDGAMPNAEAKRVLLDSVIAAVGQDVNIIDQVEINADVKALDFSSAGPFFDAAAGIPDFGLVVGGDTVTLSGTAEVAADQQAVEAAATKAWPYVNIVSTIQTVGPQTVPPAATPPGR